MITLSFSATPCDGDDTSSLRSFSSAAGVGQGGSWVGQGASGVGQGASGVGQGASGVGSSHSLMHGAIDLNSVSNGSLFSLTGHLPTHPDWTQTGDHANVHV